MSLEQLFYRRNNIINDIFIDREFDNLMEGLYINDLEILEENAITNFFGNIIETIKRFFSRLIETVKNLFSRNKSVNSDTINEAKETINEAKKQKENNQRKEEAKKKAEETKKKEEEAKKAKEEAKKKEEEAKKAKEEAKKKAEEEARKKAEEEARRKAEEAEEAKRKAEEARKKAEEAKKEAEDDILIKGYKIQGKKLTMRNYDERATGKWLFNLIAEFSETFVIFFGFRNGMNIKDPGEFKTTYVTEFIESMGRGHKPIGANIDKIHKIEDMVYYLPLDKTSPELTKTIDVCDFNVELYQEFLKYSDKFTVDYLKKTRDRFLKDIEQYKEYNEFRSTTKEYNNRLENAKWTANQLQLIASESSKQLFKMKKEIEEIIKTIVKIGNS